MLGEKTSQQADGLKQNSASLSMRDKYEEAKKSTEKFALIIVNIKNFRYFNTRYTFQGGNEILSLLLNALQSMILEDESVIHEYADHFTMIVKYEKDDFSDLHTRMHEITDVCYRIHDPRIYRNLFLSFGIYAIQDSGCDYDNAKNLANLSRKACDCLSCRTQSYEIYNQTIHNQYMNEKLLEEQTAEAYKNYEFVPYYQPKVDPYTQKIVGAEALLRWFDGEGNAIPVNDFLPILNKNAYIYLIDLDIFEMTCKMLHENLKNKQPVVPISFNISRSCFYDDENIQPYIELREKYQIPQHLIEFELMESISLDDTKHMKEFIHLIKNAGFQCSLDDFGNGYSSFNVLLNAELDAVKMDRQFFVKNLNGDNKLMIKTVINLIKSLNIKVIAEGVEDEEHIAYLKECGCDVIQGFYYYKPMSAESFQQLLQEQHQKS